MRFTVRAFGLELLSVEASTEDEAEAADDGTDPTDGGVTGTTVVGFCASPGDQRFATPGADFGEGEEDVSRAGGPSLR